MLLLFDKRKAIWMKRLNEEVTFRKKNSSSVSQHESDPFMTLHVPATTVCGSQQIILSHILIKTHQSRSARV